MIFVHRNTNQLCPVVCYGLFPVVGFPGDSAVENLPVQAGDTGDVGSIPGLGRSPGEGNGIPVFLLGKSHGQRSLVGYSPWSHKESWT